MTQTIREDFIKKDWEKDYTSDERREIIKNNLAFTIIQSIKDKNSPLLKASTYKELAGVDSKGNIDNSNIAFNGFNGIPYDGINMLLLDTAKKANGFSTNIWLDVKQAIMLGVNWESIKNLDGVKIQHTKTIEYQAQYELDSNGNKIPLLDSKGAQRVSINGKPLFKRKMEKVPLIDKTTKQIIKNADGTPKYMMQDVFDKNGVKIGEKPLERFAPDIPKPFYTITKVPKKDEQGNIINGKDGNPIMEEKRVWNKEAILETTKVYNIAQLINTFKEVGSKERFINKLSPLRNEAKHYNKHVRAYDKGDIREIRLDELTDIKVKDKYGNIKEYGLNENTINSINNYFYARNQKKDFKYTIRTFTPKDKEINIEAKSIMNMLNSKGEEAKIKQNNKNKINDSIDNVTNTMNAISNKEIKNPKPVVKQARSRAKKQNFEASL